MCFSAAASFTSAAVVGGLGLTALEVERRRIDLDRRELVLVSLPLAFAAHQALEGAIWTQLERTGATTATGPAVSVWLFFAWVLLPVWVPLGCWLIEPPGRRRQVLAGLVGLGVAVAAFLAWQAYSQPVDATVTNAHLEYRVPFQPGWLAAIPYGVVTCVAPLLSARPFVRLFGAANSVALLATAAASAYELSSVWCFFAAGLSLIFVGHAVLAWRSEQLPELHAA